MKFLGFSLILFAAVGNVVADSEFGRAAFDEDGLDMDAAMRELVVSYDMSMSLSMSMSYGYDSQDDLDNMDGEGSNGGTPTDGDTTAPESTPAPTNVTDTNAPNATETSAPSGFPTESPTKAPLPSCYGMEFTILESPLFIETSREGISFSVLENALEDAMRDVLPFCEDLDQRRLEDAGAGGGYYIGNVDLVGGETGATCTAEVAGNNCFVGALSLKLFGETTDEDIDHILEVIEGLIENDMDEALGPENGLEDGNDGTKSGGGDQGSNASATKSSEKMSAGRKAMISILSVAVVAMVGAFAYRRMNQPNRNEEEEVSDFDRDSDDSLPHTSP